MSDATNHTEIPEALVEKAARALYERLVDSGYNEDDPRTYWRAPDSYWKPSVWDAWCDDARAALEAAAPSLRAQGMREASKVVVDRLLAYDELAAQLAMNTIAAHAEEIEGIKK